MTLADGSVVTCTATNAHSDLYFGFPNSFTVPLRKSFTLPSATGIRLVYKSKTTNVCTIAANQIVKKTNGTCLVSVTVTDQHGTVLSALKKFVFKSGS